MANHDHRLPAPHRLQGQRGAALVEFSIACVLFLGLIYGAISYGVVFWVKSTITHAAQEGARSAIGVAQADAQSTAQNFAQGVVDKTLPSNYTAHAQVSASSPEPCTNATQLTCITVTVTYPYKDHPVVPALPPVFPVLPNQLQSTATIQLTN